MSKGSKRRVKAIRDNWGLISWNERHTDALTDVELEQVIKEIEQDLNKDNQ